MVRVRVKFTVRQNTVGLVSFICWKLFTFNPVEPCKFARSSYSDFKLKLFNVKKKLCYIIPSPTKIMTSRRTSLQVSQNLTFNYSIEQRHNHYILHHPRTFRDIRRPIYSQKARATFRCHRTALFPPLCYICKASIIIMNCCQRQHHKHHPRVVIVRLLLASR